MNKDLWGYIDKRESELLGGAVASDDSRVFIANLVSDLAHAEAELMLMSSSSRSAEKYVQKSIINGNGAYADYLQGEQSKNENP